MASVLDDTRPAAVGCNDDCAESARRRAGDIHELLSAVSEQALGSREVKAGNDVYSIGERCGAIYVIVEGWVALYDLLQDGRRQILQFALPGALLGFNPGPSPVAAFGAEALTDTVVSTIAYSALASLSKAHPEIGMRFAELIARDRNLSFDHLTSIGRRSARQRVARLLLELFVRCREQWPGHCTEEMHLPLTQEHIADATGLTGVHVNRVLGELRDEGIVQFHYRKLVILDPDRLVEVAAIDPHLASGWTQREVFSEDGQTVSSEIEVAETG
jgi:CRP-like cAMP-binding protein